jgi:predicted NBD/HSP70 family sugar kinase
MLVAVDTGGTKTLIASFDKDGILDDQVKFPTPKDQIEYVKHLRSMIKDRYKGKSVEAVVVAIPGVIRHGVVVTCGNLPWKNFDVASALSGVLGDTPIFIENDAKLAGLSETRFLKQIPPQSLYVTISTGIGSGIITDGHISQAFHNSEAGHALIEYDGVASEWESFASGQAIYKTYGKYAHEITSKRVWNQIADRISRGFLAIIPILQPDVIIIGGSIGTYFDKFGEKLVGLLKEKLPEITPCPLFVKARYPELAVIYGCYFYALDNITNK